MEILNKEQAKEIVTDLKRQFPQYSVEAIAAYLELSQTAKNIKEIIDTKLASLRQRGQMAHKMNNASFESDIAEGLYNYSALAYSIETVNTGREKYVELSIISTSISEQEGSEAGILKDYGYITREEAEEDIQLFTDNSNCHLDKI